MRNNKIFTAEQRVAISHFIVDAQWAAKEIIAQSAILGCHHTSPDYVTDASIQELSDAIDEINAALADLKAQLK